MQLQRHRWKTAHIIQETADAVTIVFDTRGQRFDYKAGQFINVCLDIKGNRVVRSYSLSSAPGFDHQPAISLKRVPDGLASNYILEQARSFSHWEIEGPFGSFGLPDSPNAAQSLVFIAGGSGITPIYSMIKSALIHTTLPIRLIYSNKKPEETIFYDALQTLREKHPARLQIQHVFTGQLPEGSMKDSDHIKGRLNRLVLKKLIGSPKTSGHHSTHYFLCGPEGLIKTGNEALVALGVPPEQIRLEYFTPPEAEDKTSLPDQTLEVQFHFYEQTNLMDVNPGETILEAALKDRIPVPYSCKGGTCGVCTARLTAGKVHMRQNYALNETQINNGYVLLCQSHPLNDEVTVEIG